MLSELVGTLTSRNGEKKTNFMVSRSVRDAKQVLEVNRTYILDPSFIPMRSFRDMGLITLESKLLIVSISYRKVKNF